MIASYVAQGRLTVKPRVRLTQSTHRERERRKEEGRKEVKWIKDISIYLLL